MNVKKLKPATRTALKMAYSKLNALQTKHAAKTTAELAAMMSRNPAATRQLSRRPIGRPKHK